MVLPSRLATIAVIGLLMPMGCVARNSVLVVLPGASSLDHSTIIAIVQAVAYEYYLPCSESPGTLITCARRKCADAGSLEMKIAATAAAGSVTVTVSESPAYHRSLFAEEVFDELCRRLRDQFGADAVTGAAGGRSATVLS